MLFVGIFECESKILKAAQRLPTWYINFFFVFFAHYLAVILKKN